MKLIITLIFFSFAVFQNFCLAQWVQQTSGTTNYLTSVHFIDINTGTAVGFTGKILRTSNDGLNWTTQQQMPENLWGVHFVNANTGFISAEYGFAKTINAGSSWTFQYLMPYPIFYGIFMNDANTGYMCGTAGTIFKTTNGGTSWFSLSSGVGTTLTRIYFIDSFTGMAAGNAGVILKTTNSGTNWTPLTSGVPDNLSTVFLVNSTTAYAAGVNGIILKTIDGGLNWTQQSSGVTSPLNGIYFSNANTGTIVGFGNTTNTILRTTTGGNLWVSQTAPANDGLYAVSFKNTIDTGTIVGANGLILHTTTGGFSPPPAPNLTAPPNGAINVPVTPLLDWDSLADASTYNIQIDTDSTFNLPLTLDTNNITTSFLQVPSGVLLNYTRYYWRVRGRNFVNFGPWSSVWRFTTIVALPNAPNLLQPVNNAGNVSQNPFLDWDSTSFVDYYTLQASLDSQFVNLDTQITRYQTGITQSFLNFTSASFRANSRYYWRVNGTNFAGTGPWSSIFRFTTIITAPPPPILSSPRNDSNNVTLTPVLDWLDDVSAINYQLQVDSNSAFGSPVIDQNNLTSSFYQVPPSILLNFTRYYWRVRTTNSLGTSPYSAVWHFNTMQTIPPPPILISPANGDTGVSPSPLLDWNDIPNCTYRVQLTLSSDTGFISPLINSSGITVSQFQVSGLSNNTEYCWRINATNGAGTGPWSNVWCFRTVISAPVAPPILLLPPNGSINVSLTPLLDWTEVFGAGGYRVQVCLDSSFSPNVIDTSVISSQYTVPAARLAFMTRYYWRVRAFNSGGSGPWSEIWNFRTEPVGIKIISSEIPKEFKLYYNFPNPFNPVTKIRFDVPVSPLFGEGSGVRLVIYNLLGQQISVLVDSHLAPGKYETQWDALSFPAGVYFYRLTSSAGTDVKRMVLLK